MWQTNTHTITILHISHQFQETKTGVSTDREPPAPDGQPLDVSYSLSHWQTQYDVGIIKRFQDWRISEKGKDIIKDVNSTQNDQFMWDQLKCETLKYKPSYGEGTSYRKQKLRINSTCKNLNYGATH